MTQPIEKTVLRVVSLAGLAICVILALWGWKTGILTSQERMEALVAGCGAAGALIFTVFQAVPGGGADSARRSGMSGGRFDVRSGVGLCL